MRLVPNITSGSNQEPLQRSATPYLQVNGTTPPLLLKDHTTLLLSTPAKVHQLAIIARVAELAITLLAFAPARMVSLVPLVKKFLLLRKLAAVRSEVFK